MTLLAEGGIGVFLILTVIIGGGAAFLAGQALASKWRPEWMAVAYMVPLAAALRFLHFALFQESLFSLYYFLVAFAVLTAAGMLGYRLKRVDQMTKQYPWLYERAGPFAWKDRRPL